MKRRNIELLYNNRGIKIIWYVFITVFLGAIGSGLWERILSKWFEYISTVVMHALSKIFNGYTDILYSRIGLAQVDVFTIMPYIMFVVVVCSAQWILLTILMEMLNKLTVSSSNTDKEETNAEFVHSTKKTMYRIMIPMAAITTIFFINQAITDTYTRSACVYIERSLDILSPAITEKQLKELRAAYRNVDNANKFYALEDTLRRYSTINNVLLPKFTVIR